MKITDFFKKKDAQLFVSSFTSSAYLDDYSKLTSDSDIEFFLKNGINIDIPFDKYESASANEKIQKMKAIYRSSISFEVAKNIALSDSIEGLHYNPKEKSIGCNYIGGILFVILFDFYSRNGLAEEEALSKAIQNQLDCQKTTVFQKARNLIQTSMASSESSRLYSTALAKTFYSAQDVRLDLGFYQARMAQEASWGKLSKELAIVMASSVGEQSGRKIGSAVGSTVLSVIPFIGKKVGDTVGGALGSYGGSKLGEVISSSLMDGIESAEKIRIAFQSHFEHVCFDFALSTREIPVLHKDLSDSLVSILDEMSKEPLEKIIQQLDISIRSSAHKLVKKRSKIPLPATEKYREGLRVHGIEM